MTQPDAPLLRVTGLRKTYVSKSVLGGAKHMVRAFQDISLSVERGATLAIVGESGAGKSSLLRCLALLDQPDSGEIWYDGCNVTGLSYKDLRTFRRHVQFMFQDSTSALNPRFSAAELIEEPLVVQRIGTDAERGERALELMCAVGLSPGSANKRPLEFSGGQRQRIALARALALRPSLLFFDEALASLDVANQEAMLQLLADLQRMHSLTYVHVSHDLQLVSRFAKEVAVMYEGKIVEQAPADELFAEPQHPYTRELFAAMPPLDALLLERSA